MVINVKHILVPLLVEALWFSNIDGIQKNSGGETSNVGKI